MLAGDPVLVRFLAHGEVALRGDDELLPVHCGQEGSDDLLGAAGRVDVGAVDEVAPGIDERLQDGVGFLFPAAPVVGAERHGAQ